MEHKGVLRRLVVAFRHTKNHGLKIFTHLKLRGTDQIPNILHDKKIQLFETKLDKRVPDHVGVEMTGAARVDLYDRDPGLGYPLSIL